MADGYANPVVKADLKGRLLGTLGSPGKAPGQFAYAHRICAGRAFFVAEILNRRLQKFVPRSSERQLGPSRVYNGRL